MSFVADVPPYEYQRSLSLDPGYIGEVARVGEVVKANDPGTWNQFRGGSDEIRPDEAASSSYKYISFSY